MPPIRKAVFPVAGRGTRFLPATKAVPKEMLPLVDRPLIGYAVEEALKSGIEELIFVTAPGKEAIVQHFTADASLVRDLDKSGKSSLARMVEGETLPRERLHSTIQDKALGLGHAIWCAGIGRQRTLRRGPAGRRGDVAAPMHRPVDRRARPRRRQSGGRHGRPA